MKNKVIAFTGKKGSGKNTLANFLVGYQLRANEVIKDFSLDDNGKLHAVYEIGDGKTAEGFLDLDRDDYEFSLHASQSIWPFAKTYAFATPLKEMCVGLFGIPRELVYGTDEQKNTLVEHLRWENMPGVIPTENVRLWTFGNLENKTIATETLIEKVKKALATGNNTDIVWGSELEFEKSNSVIYHAPGPMTAREFMQFLGTEVMRKMYGAVWVNFLTKQIQQENSTLSIITDLRFPNEDVGLRSLDPSKYDVKVVGLTRCIDSGDKHTSESLFDEVKKDAVLDNANNDLLTTCQQLTEHMNDWGWFE